MSETGVIKKGITRRSFLKTTAAVGGVAALSGTLAGCSSISGNTALSTGEETVSTCTCMWTCFECQHHVISRDNRAVRVEPMPGGDANGNSPCLRGRSHLQRLYSPDRIKYPMKRIGERGANEWERISWDDAISTITTKWKSDIDQYGPGCIGFYTGGAGNVGAMNGWIYGLLTRFANIVQITGLDFCTDYSAYIAIGNVYVGSSGIAPEYPTNEIQDVVNSNAFISWGANITDAYLQKWKWIANAMEGGTKLVVIDPNFSGLAAKADLWIRSKPATDAALALSIINYLVTEKKYNEEFVLKYTAAAGLVRDDTQTYLHMSDLGVALASGNKDPFVAWDLATNSAVPLDEAERPALRGSFEIKGIKVKTSLECLMEVASEFTLENATRVTGVPEEQIVELAELTATGKVYQFPAYAIQAYNNGKQAIHAIACLPALTGGFGKPGASMAHESYMFPFNGAATAPTGTGYTPMPFYSAAETLSKGTYGGKPYPAVRNLLIIQGNPLTGLANTNKLKEDIFDKAELIVVHDINFSETARYADIVLPVTHYYETEDLIFPTYAWWVLHTDKVVDPLYECKKDADIARLYAQAMGIGEYFEISDDDYLRELFDKSPMAIENGWTLDTIRRDKFYRTSKDQPHVSYTEMKFQTESGRVEFYVNDPQPRYDYGQEVDLNFERLPHYVEATEASPDNPLKEKYPFVLTSQRNRTRWHSNGFVNPWMTELMPEPTIFINTDDATSRGVNSGDYVEVFNDRGHAVAKAIVTQGLMPGSVRYPKGFHDFEFKSGSWSQLLTDVIDKFTVNTSFMDNRVDFKLWKEGA